MLIPESRVGTFCKPTEFQQPYTNWTLFSTVLLILT